MLAETLALSGVGTYAFHGWRVRAALVDRAANWSGLGPPRIGSASIVASFHGTFEDTKIEPSKRKRINM